jgi:hypothetical protein
MKIHGIYPSCEAHARRVRNKRGARQCVNQQMRNRAIILAVLLTATPTLAVEQCVEVKEDPNSDAPPTYAKYADTLTCYLRVDGHILVNGRCRVGISGDTGLWTLKDDLAEAHLRRELPGRPYYARVKKRGKWVNYGPVDRVNLCFLNTRFQMCFARPYLICDPETIKAQQAN